MEREKPREFWRGAVNGVLYGAQFQEELTSDLAARVAPGLIQKPLAGLTAEQQLTALSTAAESGNGLTNLIPEAHSEDDFRTFLWLVIDQMEKLRPWPEPPYTEVNITQWSDFTEPVLIARFPKSTPKAERKLGTIFWRLEDIGKRAAVLQLTSSAMVAFVDRWWPESNAIAIVTDGQRDPEAVIAELIEATSLTADDIERL